MLYLGVPGPDGGSDTVPMCGVIGWTPPLKLLLGVAGDNGNVAMPIVGVRGKDTLEGDVW